MWTFFESIIDPFKSAEGRVPPQNNVFKFILHFAMQAPWVFLAVLIFGGLQAIVEISLFRFIGQIVDAFDASTPADILTDYGGMLLGMAIFVLVVRLIVIGSAQVLAEQVIGPSFYNMVRWQNHRSVSRQSLAFFQNDFAGRIVTKVTQSGMAVGNVLINALDTVWLIVLYLIGTLALFAGLDLKLAMFLMAWCILYALVLWRYIPRIRKCAKQFSEKMSVLNGRLVDSYANAMLTKIDSDPAREDAFVADGMKGYVASIRQFGRNLTAMRLLVAALNSLMIVGVAALCLSLWRDGAASVGEVAFALSLALRLNLLAARMQSQMNMLFRNIGQAQDAMKTVAQPIALQDAEDAKPLVLCEGAIQFDKVHFHYQQKDKQPDVIENLSVSIKGGEKVGLVGASGAGKTTLITLLLRLFDVDEGVISIDGQAIQSVTQASLRSNIGVVSQDTAILNRSIRDNIAFPRPDASEEDILQAAKQAQAHEFIERLSDAKDRTGYDAHCGERGVKLSGGQRQRIAIARAILKDAPILVLDEATSALDSTVEAVIQEQLYALMEGKTVIAIAHRLSTIAAMDRLIIMDKGRIVEQGSHDELIALGGHYAGLWARQSGGFLEDA